MGVLSRLASRATDPQRLETAEQVLEVTNHAMRALVGQSMASAFDILHPYVAPDNEAVLHSMAQRLASRPHLQNDLGRTLGFELLESKGVGQSLLKLCYMEKCEKSALKWEFMFYRGREEWALVKFRWGDAVDELLS
jgi:hypothetical protein